MKTLEKNSKVTGTPVSVEFLGGPCDGDFQEVDCQKESIMVKHDFGKTKYTDTGRITSVGRLIYRCASGGGKLREDFLERNP